MNKRIIETYYTGVSRIHRMETFLIVVGNRCRAITVRWSLIDGCGFLRFDIAKDWSRSSSSRWFLSREDFRSGNELIEIVDCAGRWSDEDELSALIDRVLRLVDGFIRSKPSEVPKQMKQWWNRRKNRMKKCFGSQRGEGNQWNPKRSAREQYWSDD